MSGEWTMLEDFELLERWQTGDAAAGSTLFRRHVHTLFLFFRNKVLAPPDVEDLVQNTMLACVGARERIWARSSFRAFALGVARKVLFRYFESKRRDAARVRPLLWSVQDLGDLAPAQLAASEEQQMLVRALTMIPVDFQLTLELVYWHELETCDVAAVLGIAPATVRTRVARGKALLTRALRRLNTGVDRGVRELMSAQASVGSRGLALQRPGSDARASSYS